MKIRKFNPALDLPALEAFLRNQYVQTGKSSSWLPERLHDLIYRIAPHETDGGRAQSLDYIFLWEEDGAIVACILPDGENVYMSVRAGFEHLYPAMLAYSEENCLPLFKCARDGSVKFWVAVSDSCAYMIEHLQKSGYQRFAENEYSSCAFPMEQEVSVSLPEGFRLRYGEEYPDEEKKWGAHHLGFHPEHEGSGYLHSMRPYHSRKNSPMYRDSFECIVVDERSRDSNNVCAYSFVYVDRLSKTALIEPVSTREKYQHRGFGTAMMHGVMRRCKALGIEKCYVNSFGWRGQFYEAAGFCIEDSVGFWYKTLK